MKRRGALFSLAALCAAPLGARAQPAEKVWRIGVLRAGPDDAVFRENFDHFRQALEKAGFVEKRNLAFESRVQPGKPEKIVALANELVRAKVDAVLAIAASGVNAAARATSSIPIIGVDLESDPVGSGFAANLARPGGNVTGLFLDFPELSGKWIELLKHGLPNLRYAAVLWDPAMGAYMVKGAQSGSAAMQVQVLLLQAGSPSELRSAFESMSKRKVEALLALSSPVFNSARKQIATLALDHRLPAIMPFPGFADDGGLIAYGPHLQSLFRQAGDVVVRILRGAHPRTIPIERPTRFELAINLRTAKALGIPIPPVLRVRADRLIE